jgi:hypothetical protein
MEVRLVNFLPERGLRQGDPLSPFLFILGTEVISRLLLQQESHDLLKSIKIARNCTSVSHLLFADDLILFAKATSAEAITLKSCIDIYCRWSGQAINCSKSSIHFSKNRASSTINSISGIFPFKRASISSAPQILIVLFLIYLFDNIIQLISLRSLWYYGGW